MLRTIATQQAEAVYREVMRGVFGLILERIEWRWDNAALLALRAKRMIVLLTTGPGRVAFRRLRIRFWRARYRVHSARAWAADSLLASACDVWPEGPDA